MTLPIMTRTLLTRAPAAILACLLASTLAHAQFQRPSGQSQTQPQAQAQTPTEDLNAAIAKSNAYIGLMNRTLRAVESWNRYTSWVNVKTGPTGKERYIDYGLYSLYDVADEIKAAIAATDKPPAVSDLDATVARYVAAYQELAPLITQANGYYERKDYKSDNMAEGKALHAKMAPAADKFLLERRNFELQMEAFKTDLDRKDLAAIEAAEGKSPRWYVKNVMMGAGRVIDLMPTNKFPVVDMAAFDTALNTYAAAVREMDTYAQSNPNKFFVFESQPRSLLGKLRDFRDKLAKSKGDARKGAGGDIMWIINDYNMMVSSAQSAKNHPSAASRLIGTTS